MSTEYEGEKPPSGYYYSSREWFAQTNLQHQGACYKEFYYEDRISFKEPTTLDDFVHWIFIEGQKRHPPPNFLAKIPEGRVWGPDGAVIAPDNKLLWDVSLYYYSGGLIPEFHPVFQMSYLPPVTKRKDTIAVLTFCSSGNYYHWMFDVLSRIHLLRVNNLADHPMIFNDKGLFFQEETLQALGIPPSQIIRCHPHFHLKAGKLVVPSFPGYTGNAPQWACDFLRNELLHKSNITKTPGYERIYISRDNSYIRKVVNEDKVMEILSKYGFIKIFLEQMPVAEQIGLFYSAEAVVSPHGAGLTNLIFCNSGTKVLELFSPNYVYSHYWALSNKANLDYYYLLGKGERPVPYDEQANGYIADNITVNLEQLRSMLNIMGI